MQGRSKKTTTSTGVYGGGDGIREMQECRNAGTGCRNVDLENADKENYGTGGCGGDGVHPREGGDGGIYVVDLVCSVG